MLMAKWEELQSAADRRKLERLKGKRDGARDEYNKELRRQKSHYEYVLKKNESDK